MWGINLTTHPLFHAKFYTKNLVDYHLIPTQTLVQNMTQSQSLQAIVYQKGQLKLLDQRLLPLQSEFIAIKTTDDAFHAIRDMVVRGAPAIGVTAALATAVELYTMQHNGQIHSLQQLVEWIETKMTFLAER